jgi:hypothetical protein
MRQAPLLKLNDIYVGFYFPNYVLVQQTSPQLLQLGSEHSSHEIWTVLRALSWIWLIFNLIPIRIARDGEKDVRFSILPHQGHRVHILAPHITGPLMNIGDRMVHFPTSLASSTPYVAVNQTLVQVSPHSILIISDEVKTRAFNLHVGVDGKLLEQTLAVWYRVENARPHLQPVRIVITN